ncbi:MAG: lipopolysaccharide heptosyltransferase II [Candidatus Omnitrophota bacterium]
MEKFLIINPFGIGDVLFTTPLIKAIKQAYPQAPVSYWCNERVKEIFKNNPDIDKVFALSRGDLKKIFQRSKLEGITAFWRLLQGIKKERFSTAIDFSLDHRYGLIAKLLGIKQRIGFNYKNRGRFLTHKRRLESYEGRHVVEYYLSLLEFLGITPKSKDLEISIPDAGRARAENILNRAGITPKDTVVGIAAGAGASWGQNASYKHWPAIKYAQLADKIIESCGARVIILGDSSESPIADIITAAMKNNPVDLTGKLSLTELLAVIAKLNLLITNDGGPLHIAVACGVKTVSIFGPVDSAVYGPYPPSEKHLVIKNNSACGPCYKNFKLDICVHDKECINSISTEEVFAAVSRQLGVRSQL